VVGIALAALEPAARRAAVMTMPTVPSSISTRRITPPTIRVRRVLDRSVAIAAAMPGWNCGG
jgi:hypothetical protein